MSGPRCTEYPPFAHSSMRNAGFRRSVATSVSPTGAKKATMRVPLWADTSRGGWPSMRIAAAPWPEAHAGTRTYTGKGAVPALALMVTSSPKGYSVSTLIAE